MHACRQIEDSRRANCWRSWCDWASDASAWRSHTAATLAHMTQWRLRVGWSEWLRYHNAEMEYYRAKREIGAAVLERWQLFELSSMWTVWHAFLASLRQYRGLRQKAIEYDYLTTTPRTIRALFAWWAEWVDAVHEEEEIRQAEISRRKSLHQQPRVDVALRQGMWPFDDSPDSEDEEAEAEGGGSTTS